MTTRAAAERVVATLSKLEVATQSLLVHQLLLSATVVKQERFTKERTEDGKIVHCFPARETVQALLLRTGGIPGLTERIEHARREGVYAPRLGAALKRVIGHVPVRVRTQRGIFRLIDQTDREAGQRVRSDIVQFDPPNDAGCIVIDIDKLDGDTAVLAPFASERLAVAAYLLSAVLRKTYGIELSWFASGKKGLHAHAFGLRVDDAMRRRVCELLPTSLDDMVCKWKTGGLKKMYAAIHDERGEATRFLSTLDFHSIDKTNTTCRVWVEAMTKVFDEGKEGHFMTATFVEVDVSVTKSGSMRTPCTRGESTDGGVYFSYPLSRPTLPPNGDWAIENLRRAVARPLSVEELVLLERCTVHTAAEAEAIRGRLGRATTVQSTPPKPQKPPNVLPIQNKLTHPPRRKRDACRAHISQFLHSIGAEAMERLIDGMMKGGTFVSKWRSEPPGDSRTSLCSRAPSVKRSGNALALEYLRGPSFDTDARKRIVASLVASAFPVDEWARAFLASPVSDKRPEVLQHLAGLFKWTINAMNAANDPNKTQMNKKFFRYDTGVFEPMRVQNQTVTNQAKLAEAIFGDAFQKCTSPKIPSISPSVSMTSVSTASTTSTVSTVSTTSTASTVAAASRPPRPPSPVRLDWTIDPTYADIDYGAADERTYGEIFCDELLRLYSLAKHNNSKSVPMRTRRNTGVGKSPLDKHAIVDYDSRLKGLVSAIRTQRHEYTRLAEEEGWNLNLLVDDLIIIDIDSPEALEYFNAEIYTRFTAEFDAAPLQKTQKGRHFWFVRPSNCRLVFHARAFLHPATNTPLEIDCVARTSTGSRGNVNVWPSKNKTWLRCIHKNPPRVMSAELHAFLDNAFVGLKPR